MKNYLLLFVSLILFNSCENDKISVIHPDFEKNKEIFYVRSDNKEILHRDIRQ